jgi:hypothetical protein
VGAIRYVVDEAGDGTNRLTGHAEPISIGVPRSDSGVGDRFDSGVVAGHDSGVVGESFGSRSGVSGDPITGAHGVDAYPESGEDRAYMRIRHGKNDTFLFPFTRRSNA